MRIFEGIEQGLVTAHPEVICRPFFHYGPKAEAFFRDTYAGMVGLLAETSWIDRVLAWGKPCLNVSSRVAQMPIPSVVNDEEKMGRLAAEYLIRYGPSVLYFLTEPGFDAHFHTLRLRGATLAAEETGTELRILDARAEVVQGIQKKISLRGGVLADQLRSCTPPVHILVSEVRFAEWLREAIYLLDWTLGKEVVALQIGAQMQDLYRGTNGMSYIPHDWRSVGETAGKVLAEWMVEGISPSEKLLIPPLEPVLRSSTQLGEHGELIPRLESLILHSDDYGWTVDGLAQTLGVHSRTLSEKYRHVRGESLKSWLMVRKHQRACHLLKHTLLPVEKIAYLSGFSNPRSFTLAFRQREGVPPSKWRTSAG